MQILDEDDQTCKYKKASHVWHSLNLLKQTVLIDFACGLEGRVPWRIPTIDVQYELIYSIYKWVQISDMSQNRQRLLYTSLMKQPLLPLS